jgi:hypothetical protein
MIGWSGLWQAGWVDLDRSTLGYLLPATRVLFQTFSARTITGAAANLCMRLRVRSWSYCYGHVAAMAMIRSAAATPISVPRCEQSGELDSKTFNILVGQKPRRVHSRVSDASATRATRNGTVSCSTSWLYWASLPAIQLLVTTSQRTALRRNFGNLNPHDVAREG